MLAGLVGIVVAAGLLLRGACDLWVQSALVLVLLAGGAAWICGRIATGWLPRPELMLLSWVAALAASSAGSAWLSPVPAYARSAWTWSAAGLAIFPLVSVIDAESRARLERFVRVTAWILVLLAFYQRLHGETRPPASMIDQNAFAGAILLLLPIAARARDGALAAGLLLCLWWTRSVGAWLGLSAVLILHRRAVGAAAFWLGVAAGFVSLLAALQSSEVLHRLEWWRAAWRMAADSPWMGLGPGAYAYVLPAYVLARPELSSLYAHQHVLETAAERGWPYTGFWLAGLVVLLKPAPMGRRFGPIAALIHGLMDYTLSIPGVFWLFCVSAALAAPESGSALNIPSRRRPLLCALVLAAAGAAVFSIWRGTVGR